MPMNSESSHNRSFVDPLSSPSNDLGSDVASQRDKFIRNSWSHLVMLAPAAILLLCLAKPGVACVCAGAEEPPCVAYQRADAVFGGTVTKLRVVPVERQQTFLKELLVYFSVEEPFKGVTVDELEVVTPKGTDCDLDFRIGDRYFVYAYQISQTRRLTTGACTRTRKMSNAREDIDEIHNLAMSGHRTWLIGTDGKPSSLLAGAEVIVDGQGKRSFGLADKQGDFRIALPGGGTHKVTIIAPAGIELLSHSVQWRIFVTNGRNAVEFERSVVEGECDFLDFSRMLTAKEKK